MPLDLFAYADSSSDSENECEKEDLKKEYEFMLFQDKPALL